MNKNIGTEKTSIELTNNYFGNRWPNKTHPALRLGLSLGAIKKWTIVDLNCNLCEEPKTRIDIMIAVQPKEAINHRSDWDRLWRDT